MRTPLCLALSVLLLGTFMSSCHFFERQALRLYLAANPNLELADGPVRYHTQAADLLLVPVADSFEFPWDFAFLSDEEVLVTEKPGRLSRLNLKTGALTQVHNVPKVAFIGQGGLLGVELHPDFSANALIYLSYAVALDDGTYTTRLTRARLVDDALADLEVLLTAAPSLPGINHFGGALKFNREGYLFLSVGERLERKYAQDLSSHLGKILRLKSDGAIPTDNPFFHDPEAQASIFTLGHRNPQGLALHPQTGALWSSEHGPRGGDEINVINAGRNYGWPIISYGEEYSGGQVGIGTHRDGLEQPVHYYKPSIATAGIGFYSGDQISAWTGNLFVGGLIGTQLNRLAFNGEKVTTEESLFTDLWLRVRAVKESPIQRDLYVLAENGVLFRIEPSK
jgi:aldose sugar dehydrogenase